jgi:DNA invertase Pin-like site-specific DNA recombinase
MSITAVYARASKDKDDKRVSVDRQVERCRALAEDLFPDQSVMTFVDNDKSGADPDVVRPGYNEMLAFIRRGEISAVVVHEQSRLTRIPEVWSELVVALTKAGIAKIHTVQQGAVSVDPGNRLVGSIMALIDAEEVERAKARQRAAKEQLRAEGRPGGWAPYGYRTTVGDDGRPAWVIEADEAEAIRRISDIVCDGHSLSSVVAQLNAGTLSAPRRLGRPWSQGGLRNILVRPSVAGLRSRTVREKGRAAYHEVVGPARWEPIITEERWRQTLDALGALTVTGSDGRSHMVNRSHPHRPTRWLLSTGMARCGQCGGQMTVTLTATKSRSTSDYIKYRKYRCNRFMGGCGKCGIGPAETFETWIHDQLVEYLAANPKLVATLARVDPERERLEEGRRRARRSIDEALVLKREDEIDIVAFRELHSAAKARLAKFQAAIDALPVTDTEIPDADAIRNRWEELPLARKQKALIHYIEAITVGPPVGNPRNPAERIARRVTITWRN